MDKVTQWLVVYTAMWIWGMICLFARDLDKESLLVGVLWYGVAGLIALAAVTIITRKP
jgi:hypothetical protein